MACTPNVSQLNLFAFASKLISGYNCTYVHVVLHVCFGVHSCGTNKVMSISNKIWFHGWVRVCFSVFLPEHASVRVCVFECVCILWPLGLPVSHSHEVNPSKAVLVLSNSSLAHGRLSQGDLCCLCECVSGCVLVWAHAVWTWRTTGPLCGRLLWARCVSTGRCLCEGEEVFKRARWVGRHSGALTRSQFGMLSYVSVL